MPREVNFYFQLYEGFPILTIFDTESSTSKVCDVLVEILQGYGVALGDDIYYKDSECITGLTSQSFFPQSPKSTRAKLIIKGKENIENCLATMNRLLENDSPLIQIIKDEVSELFFKMKNKKGEDDTLGIDYAFKSYLEKGFASNQVSTDINIVTNLSVESDKIIIETGLMGKVGDMDLCEALAHIATGFSLPFERLISYTPIDNFVFDDKGDKVSMEDFSDDIKYKGKYIHSGFTFSIDLVEVPELIARCEQCLACYPGYGSGIAQLLVKIKEIKAVVDACDTDENYTLYDSGQKMQDLIDLRWY
jgi:hypothetical protein